MNNKTTDELRKNAVAALLLVAVILVCSWVLLPRSYVRNYAAGITRRFHLEERANFAWIFLQQSQP